MHSHTKQFVEAHLKHLQKLKVEAASEEILKYDTLYDHMHAFFLTLGLSSEDAARVIDDFRGK